MAKVLKRISGISKRPGFDEFAGLFLLLAAIVAVAALFDYAPSDPTWFQVSPDRQVTHSFGRVGALASHERNGRHLGRYGRQL